MVTSGMRRFKVRTPAQATLVGPEGDEALDLEQIFGGRYPVRLEIGIGHGEFLSALAAAHPEERLIGVEYDHLRVTKTAHKCLRLGVDNMRLFADEAHHFVRYRMPVASAHRAYILFPDPWPKAGHRRRRLMTRSFLLDISRAVAPGGQLIIASDTHNYAFQALSNLTALPGLWRNLYPNGYRFDIPTRFPTVFERYKKAEGCTICYLRLERTAVLAPEPVPWRSHDPSSGSGASGAD